MRSSGRITSGRRRRKGLRKLVVVNKHALKNAVLPIVTVIGNALGVLLGGAVVIETVFTITGVGRLPICSVLRQKYHRIQGRLRLTAVAPYLAQLSDTLPGWMAC